MNTCCIAIIEDGDIGSEALYEAYLRFGKRRSATRHHILNTRLMHGDDVHLSLDEVTSVGTRDSLFGLEESVQFVGFGIDDRVRRVDVLADIVLLFENTSGESDGFAADGEDRKDDAVPEAVVESSVFTFSHDADTYLRIDIVGDKLLFETFGLQRLRQRIAFLRRVTELVFPNDIVPQSPFTEIFKSDSLSFGRVP